jgi:hypothetical protein
MPLPAPLAAHQIPDGEALGAHRAVAHLKPGQDRSIADKGLTV